MDIQGCGTIRVIYPYLLLNHFLYHNNKVSTGGTYLSNFIYDPMFYKNFTFVQFQRAAEDYHIHLYSHIIKEVRKYFKIPIIYEIDDMLFNIPKWNYASDYYNKNEENVKKLMEMSDAIIVSTPFLKKSFSNYNKKISIIPNHLAKFVWGDIYPKHLNEPREKKPKIIWAGSENHFSLKGNDGGDFGSKLIDFIKKTVDKYEWNLLGACPSELNNFSDKIKIHSWVKIFQYPYYIKSIDADIGIAPLSNCDFNRCKSNIKALEYVACGIPGVYSDIDPYSNMTIKCGTEEYMISKIEELASDIDMRSRTWEKDYKIVKSQLWWEEDNNLKKYVETYLNLFGKKLP